MVRPWLFLCLTVLAGASPAVAQQASVASDGPSAARDQRLPYVLGVGDVIETAAIGRTDFNARVQIGDDGAIALPFVGSVPAAGRTVLQLRDDLRKRLISGGFLENPVVAVSIATYASRFVTVLGQVNQPGVVSMDRAYRLSEIVARVGGANAAADTVVLTRLDGTSQTVSLRAIAGAPVGQDPTVQPGDKVFVAPPSTFYIYGAVNTPGAFPMARAMTVQMALARGGGLTPVGSAKRVKIVRGGQELKADLDEQLRPDDVLVVGERFF